MILDSPLVSDWSLGNISALPMGSLDATSVWQADHIVHPPVDNLC